MFMNGAHIPLSPDGCTRFYSLFNLLFGYEQSKMYGEQVEGPWTKNKGEQGSDSGGNGEYISTYTQLGIETLGYFSRWKYFNTATRNRESARHVLVHHVFPPVSS